LSSNIRVIDSTQVERARHVSGTTAKLNAHKKFDGKSGSKTPRERPKSRWENNIKTYFKEADCGVMDLNDVF
jgi:hypothetical protein